MPFTGEFRHSIDAKGRLIVPAKLRDELSGKVTLAVYLDGCIGMWSEESWEQLRADVVALGRSEPNIRAFRRKLSASAHEDEIDRQGRISVPAHLREHAGIDRECVVIGAFDHAEIWSPERWAEHSRMGGDRFDELIQGLNF